MVLVAVQVGVAVLVEDGVRVVEGVQVRVIVGVKVSVPTPKEEGAWGAATYFLLQLAAITPLNTITEKKNAIFFMIRSHEQ